MPYIQCIPTKAQIELAEVKGKQIGVRNNSIRRGEGNVIGSLGEILVHDYLRSININCNYVDDNYENYINYDLTIDHNNIRTTFDVKTKGRNVQPLDHYFGSVAAFNINQNCGFYCFVNILNDKSRAWIMGYIKRNEFYDNAQFYHEGEIDPTSPPNNPFPFRADCYNLPYNELPKNFLLG